MQLDQHGETQLNPGPSAVKTIEQGSATPGTRANHGTRRDFMRHAESLKFPKHFLNVKVIKKLLSARNKWSILCCVLSCWLVINTFSILLLRRYCVYLRFNQSVTPKLIAMSAAKRSKSDARPFEE